MATVFYFYYIKIFFEKKNNTNGDVVNGGEYGECGECGYYFGKDWSYPYPYVCDI